MLLKLFAFFALSVPSIFAAELQERQVHVGSSSAVPFHPLGSLDASGRLSTPNVPALQDLQEGDSIQLASGEVLASIPAVSPPVQPWGLATYIDILPSAA